MQQKEDSPIWIYLLRFLGGYLNVTAIILFSRVLGGQTGNITKIAIAFVEGNFNTLFQLVTSAVIFILGGTASGMLKPLDKEKTGTRYGFLFVFLGLIFIFFSLTEYKSLSFLLFLAFVLGAKNGMFLSCNGILVKTTIITGTLTDIGTELGHRLKGVSLDNQKLNFHLLNLFFFLLGGGSAATIGIETTWNIVNIAGLLELFVGFYFIFINEEAFKTEKEGTL